MTQELSPRQQRYDRTWKAIHEAAYELVSTKGMRQTTVDEIAEKAGISPRTFFNYFPTKDDAVLGLRTPKLTDEILAKDAQRSDRYIFVRTTLLMLEVLEASTNEHTRKVLETLATEHPELKMRITRLYFEVENVLADFLLTIDWEKFVQHKRKGEFIYLKDQQVTSSDSKKRARTAVYLSTAALRYMTNDGFLPDQGIREALAVEAVELMQDLLRQD